MGPTAALTPSTSLSSTGVRQSGRLPILPPPRIWFAEEGEFAAGGRLGTEETVRRLRILAKATF